MRGEDCSSYEHEGIQRRATEAERGRCAAFLEQLAAVDAYGRDVSAALLKIAGHMREREKWETIMAARRDAKKPLPWESGT